MYGIPKDGKCPSRNGASELAIQEARIARAKSMAVHPAGKGKGRCFCGRPINTPGAILCAEHD